MTPAILTDRVRCRLCQKPRHRFELIGASIRGYTCRECLDWHFHAMDVLGGATPRGCQECLRTWADIAAAEKSQGRDDSRMYAVPRDGVYQLLCRGCLMKFVPKARELYKGTAFAAGAKLF